MTGLSARLLLLTVAFVMLAEVLIFAPSVARFREEYFLDRIAAAHLAVLTLDATPDLMVSDQLKQELLRHVGAQGISVRRGGMKLTLSMDGARAIDETVMLDQQSIPRMITAAFSDMASSQNAVLRVVGQSPRDPSVEIELVLDKEPLTDALVFFGQRILWLSLVISIITAGLVFIALRWLMVRPLGRLTQNMVRFREDPEDGTRILQPSDRRDEIGVAERQLADMQSSLRQSLQQKERLAALGTAVAKINHDLKGVLSSAILVFDRLEDSADPEVRRIAPGLTGSIERAVGMLSQTLSYVGADTPDIALKPIALVDLVAALKASINGLIEVRASVAAPLTVQADRDQLLRVFENLVRNAAEAGATRVDISAHRFEGTVTIDVLDNGSGLPPRAKENLFRPFQGSTRVGGTGLGLAISRELMRGQGGDLQLESTGAEGTAFRLVFFDHTVGQLEDAKP